MARMTLEEKVSQLLFDAPAIERLGIPQYYWWNECLHGVARAGKATVFPQAIALGATFDENLMFRIANTISDEGRAKYHGFIENGEREIFQGLTYWSPNVNIFRDPRWGRGQETYGEDPFLTAKLGIQFVKGLQGNHHKYLKTIATVKHFAVHNGPEASRHSFNAQTSERDFRQTYLPHFKEIIQNSNVQSVMCAYNRYNNEACCGSHYLLNEILRDECGFEGYIVSDCGAIRDIYKYHELAASSAEASALALRSGCDLNCGPEYKHLIEAIDKGLVTEEEITTAVQRLMFARFKLGFFDPDELVPYTSIPREIVASKPHHELALETAEKSIVLLKNKNNILPLDTDKFKRIAVIGPLADDEWTMWGNYHGIPVKTTTPLEGLRQKLVGKLEVSHALGSNIAEGVPIFEDIPAEHLSTTINGTERKGMKGEYFSDSDINREPVMTRIDSQLNFSWFDGAPLHTMNRNEFSIRWTGQLTVPVSGTYYFAVPSTMRTKLFVNDSLIYQIKHARYNNELGTPNVKNNFSLSLEAGIKYNIRIHCHEGYGDAFFQLLWAPPKEGLLEKALEAANRADLIVLCLGLTPRIEGEEMPISVEGFAGGDRTNLKLPSVQLKLIKRIEATGKPIVLVLMSGSALAVNWADQNLEAILETWYSGQAGGEALANVLLGDANPVGRLPVTFYKSVHQLPEFEDYNLTNQTYRYFKNEPLYPFGFGLSYTNYEYKIINCPETIQAGEKFEIHTSIRNTGRLAGEEVVQIYIKDLQSSVPSPLISLQGFKKVYLEPGESRTITFRIEPRQLAVFYDNGYWVVEPGDIHISVGGAQPVSRTPETTQVLTREVLIKGEPYVLRY